LSLEEFSAVTGLDRFPDYLKKDMDGDKLKVYCNGEMVYRINGKYAKVSVTWNYRAPERTGDTHYSMMRGTKSDLVIKQGAEEGFEPTLYIMPKGQTDFGQGISKAMEQDILVKYPGTTAEKIAEKLWKINIPQEFKVGHEAHFAQVTQNYLHYLGDGQLPAWEVPNMITKYYTIMEGYKLAKNGQK